MRRHVQPDPIGARHGFPSIVRHLRNAAILMAIGIQATGSDPARAQGVASSGNPPSRAESAGEPVSFTGAGRCRFWVDNYDLTAKTEDAINRVVEEALHKHESVFGFKARPDFHVRVRIFGRFADFESFTRTNRFARQIVQSSLNLSNLGGYYSHGSRQIVTWPQRHPTDLGNTLLHEASHAILHSAFRQIPIWLSEGSATYFAYPRHLQDNRDLGGLQYRWAKLNVLLRGGQLPAVRTVLNWSEAEWHRLDPALTYTVSWSLFQLLMSKPDRQDAMRRYVNALQARRRPEADRSPPGGDPRPPDSAGALSAQWPGGLTQLEKDWHDWIRQGGARVLGPRMEEILQQVR